jgi:hypothetical protein
MTPPNRLLAAVAVIASSAVAFPAAASAFPKPGEATIQQEFPVASGLCAKVAAGTENKHIAADLPVAQAACTTLESTFKTASTTALTARTTLIPQIASEKSAMNSACAAVKPALGCNRTRQADHALVKSLKAQLSVANHTYFVAVDNARTAFWTAIRTIPDEHHVATDQPLPIPPR